MTKRCEACGHENSAPATHCAGCGRKYPRFSHGATIALIGVGVLAVGLVVRMVGGDTAHPAPAAQTAPASPAAPFASPSAFAAEVAKRVEIRPVDKFGQIVGEEAGVSGYRLAIIYREPPQSHAEVEADTKRVARAALDVLQAAGVQPARDAVFLSVWARRPVRGETGAEMVRMYGNSRYDYGSDSLRYEPFKG